MFTYASSVTQIFRQENPFSPWLLSLQMHRLYSVHRSREFLEYKFRLNQFTETLVRFRALYVAETNMQNAKKAVNGPTKAPICLCAGIGIMNVAVVWRRYFCFCLACEWASTRRKSIHFSFSNSIVHLYDSAIFSEFYPYDEMST